MLNVKLKYRHLMGPLLRHSFSWSPYHCNICCICEISCFQLIFGLCKLWRTQLHNKTWKKICCFDLHQQIGKTVFSFFFWFLGFQKPGNHWFLHFELLMFTINFKLFLASSTGFHRFLGFYTIEISNVFGKRNIGFQVSKFPGFSNLLKVCYQSSYPSLNNLNLLV